MRALHFAKRTFTFLAFCAIMLFGFSAFLSFRIKASGEEMWEKLGISKVKGAENIKASFLNGYLHYYGAKHAKNILVNDRAAIAKDILVYARQELTSENFLKEYAKLRDRSKPREYPYTPKAKEELRKEKIAELNKSIKDAEELVKKMPEMEKTMRPTIDLFKKNAKEYENPNSEMIELFYQNELNIKSQREKTYADHMKRWQEEYPENVQILIKKRLKEFLKIAKTVDFSAQLKEVSGKKKFVNPKYEAESSNWKMIFRAGKEVVQPAIKFSEDWLMEMGS